MSVQMVREYFAQFGIENWVLEFPVSSETVALAALAVGCEENRITKTMSFLVENRPILICMAGDARISNPKYREQFHTKARMIPADQVEALIGHDVGGVCPFGICENVEVYLDISLKRFPTVFPGAGSGNSAIELTPAELEQYGRAKAWVDVCKDWEEEHGN